MAAIGGVNCDFVRGHPAGGRMRGRTWHTPGFSGYGAQMFGIGDSRFSIVLVHFGTLAEVTTWVAAIEALQYALVSITNDSGITFTNRLIERVSPPIVQPAITPGYTHTRRAEFRVEGVAI